MQTAVVLLIAIGLETDPVTAQDRKAKMVNDRDAFQDSDLWTYNNLDAGLAQAKKTGKPLLVVLRCIP